MKVTERLTLKQKSSNKNEWYKHKADLLDSYSLSTDERLNMRVNYDLYNNRVKMSEFEYVCKPLGTGVGELPARLTNKDIVSGKIKALLGMEMKRAFNYKAVAVNSEATTRKEQKQFDMIRQSVINQIMLPIQQELMMQQQQLAQNQKLTEEQVQQIQQQSEAELESKTPEEVKLYMQRKYQDPAEVLSTQLLKYLEHKCDLKHKFNNMFKHSLLSAREIMYVGILNGEPEVWVVNPLRFNYDRTADGEFVEDGDWATCEYRMTASQIVSFFGDDLDTKQIDKIYETQNTWYTDDPSDLFIQSAKEYKVVERGIPVIHCVWKSLRKVGFLDYIDIETGEIETMVVDENYKLNPDAGDIELKWEWIPECYETWKIKTGDPIYVKCQPVPGQFKDLDNLYYCKLPYYGAIVDGTNSEETSLMDRLKYYQYFYNIIMYRIELLLASDKGKKVMMNINAIPDDLGIDMKKWQYFMESSPYMWYNSNQEGTTYNDANTLAKVIDLSLASDINNYINLAEYIRQQCGRSVGITDQVEGQIGARESVGNVQQSLLQSANILEPYFQLHDKVKQNVLTALIETAKIAYSSDQPLKISYALDDMSQQLLTIEPGILDNNTIGIFITDTSRTEVIKQLIEQLAHAALQNQTVELSDVISILKKDSVAEAEETLRIAEEERQKRASEQQQQQQQYESEMFEKQKETKREEHEFAKELLLLKEEERRKTEIAKVSIMGASFNSNADNNNNGVNDFVELANSQLKTKLRMDRAELDREKFEYQKQKDKIDQDIKKEKNRTIAERNKPVDNKIDNEDNSDDDKQDRELKEKQSEDQMDSKKRYALKKLIQKSI